MRIIDKFFKENLCGFSSHVINLNNSKSKIIFCGDKIWKTISLRIFWISLFQKKKNTYIIFNSVSVWRKHQGFCLIYQTHLHVSSRVVNHNEITQSVQSFTEVGVVYICYTILKQKQMSLDYIALFTNPKSHWNNVDAGKVFPWRL